VPRLRKEETPAGTDFSAALLIDMQEKFVRSLCLMDREMLVRSQTAVIRHCAAHDTPLIVLEFVDYGKTISELRTEIEEVPRASFITKSSNNGFRKTGLEEMPEMRRADSLLLMGINASYCVLATAKCAVEKRYRVITAFDLIANGNDIDQKVTLDDAQKWLTKKCEVLPNVGHILAR
jgi:nicotinamidase-related amidase